MSSFFFRQQKWCEPHTDLNTKTINECRPVAQNVYCAIDRKTRAQHDWCIQLLFRISCVVARSCSQNFDICRCCCTFDQGRHAPYLLASSKLRKRLVRRLPIMYTKSRSNNRLTRDPLSLLQQSRPRHSPEFRAPCNIFVDSARRLCVHEKRPLVHISLAVLHKSVFISSLQFPDSLQKRSPGCSPTDPYAWSKEGNGFDCLRSCPSSTRQSEATRRVHRAWETQNRAPPPFVKWMYVRARIRKPLGVTMRRRKKFAKTISFLYLRSCCYARIAVSWWGFDQHAHYMHEPIWGRWPLSPPRRGAVAACSRIMIAGNRDWSPFAMHGCTVSHLIFLIRTFSLWVSQLFAVPRIRFANCDAKSGKLLPV